MTMNNFYVPESAMAIVAHPDDIEFSCSGTMARWAKTGTRISYVVCTNGEVGIAEPGMTKEKAAEIRQAEQREAARIAGANEVIFLGEPDGLLQATLELRKKLVREIRRFRPEVVITADPTRLFGSDTRINHPDHRAAGIAALDAVFPAAGQPNLFQELEQEGLKAFKPCKVYVSAWDGANLFVNIEETIDTKIAALRAHKSQMKDWDPEGPIKEWAAERAKGKEMGFAETFRVITLVQEEECLEAKRDK
ncbi:MAG: PIG-L family deacetylase [Anaerolineaceae bacterium]|nr:PIG-L family deacetylase [Anaerolineaceae bacterium]